MRLLALMLMMLAAAGCSRLSQVGRAPDFTPVAGSGAARAIVDPGRRAAAGQARSTPSLWANGRESLLGDRRAETTGDILTVVVEIDDTADIDNTSSRSRSGAENLGIAALLGIPNVVGPALPGPAGLDPAVDTTADSSYTGDGQVSRSESIELRLAAVVTDVMANGVLRIEGSQEVRVNYELRALTVSGFVRPQDISRRNEIPYDKIASARIGYGGRGQITDVQQPRYGQQIADILLPF